jgi:hypothetical protein
MIPFTPAAIKAGVIINPPPAPIHPVIRPAPRPMAIETKNIMVE